MAAYENYHRRVLESMRNSMASVAGVPPSITPSMSRTRWEEDDHVDLYGVRLKKARVEQIEMMLQNMSPQMLINELQRSERLALENHWFNEQSDMMAMRFYVQRKYLEHWTTEEKAKIMEAQSDPDKLDINHFLKKANPIKLKQEE